jgi:glutamate-1-semialdehyde 2,1-aminomutase
VYPRLHALGASFRDAIARVLAAHGLTAQVIGDGPLAQIVFSAEPIRDYRSAYRSDRALGRRLMLALFERGIFLNPMGTKLYLSLAHDEAVCGDFCDRLDAALGALGADAG